MVMEINTRDILIIIGVGALSFFAGWGLIDFIDGTDPIDSIKNENHNKENPFVEREIEVQIITNNSRVNATKTLNQSLNYWEKYDKEHLGYNISFDVADENTSGISPQTDVVVLYKPKINDESAFGTARYTTHYETGEIVGTPVVEIDTSDDSSETYLTNEAIWLITTHEFGHLLGLDHGDSPRCVMVSGIDVNKSGDISRTKLENGTEIGRDRLLNCLSESVSASELAGASLSESGSGGTPSR
ncbi:matrixin family metalloprotease (plasmid) [Halorubrum sp. BOL3-1]|uniref:M57 family metalloprotease n=1 Tax=Halorubrum sp. BOL3-1 TaxID=2497325 RepID=UPI00100518CC|nr:M57 family metalloprotease [Halorubrum sp. BOL3-1]QAU11360.1 matrixin family metalloprotease [Halorubrum sp. BOL3-1]